jgi:hypothetical protein
MFRSGTADEPILPTSSHDCQGMDNTDAHYEAQELRYNYVSGES